MRLFIIISIFLSMSACQWLGYKQHHIEQGNAFTAQEVAQLHPGMSKREVENIMGTPVYDNHLDPGRWEYINTNQFGSDPMIRVHVTIEFQGDRVTRIIDHNHPALDHPAPV